jgi:hypothetical protein
MPNEITVVTPMELIFDELKKGTPVSDLTQLFDLQERWEKQEAEKAWNRAMMACQRDMPPLLKTSENKHKRIWYAGFEQLDRQIRPIYLREGFSLCFTELDQPNKEVCRMAVDVLHVLGHSKRFVKDVHIDGVGIQGKPNMTATQADGSTSSYCRRYVTKMAFNLRDALDEDLDGDAAGNANLTAEEIKTLKDMIEEIIVIRDMPFNVPKFSAVFREGATKLEEIPRCEFTGAVSELNRWRRVAEKGGK